MRFIEMTGKQLIRIINDGEMSTEELNAAGVSEDTVVRINEFGDIEVRRPAAWDAIGGLLGEYGERVKGVTGLDWV